MGLCGPVDSDDGESALGSLERGEVQTDIVQERKLTMSSRKVFVFDTTLRDGEQVPGAKLNKKEKVEIAKQLGQIGRASCRERV
mgnify:CR=1 FL=1